MNYLNKLERKIGKYAIPNLSLWLVVTYALGYLMMYMTPGIISYLMLEPAMVLRGQVWRLVTWVLIPHLFLYYYDYAVLFLRNGIRAYLGNLPF